MVLIFVVFAKYAWKLASSQALPLLVSEDPLIVAQCALECRISTRVQYSRAHTALWTFETRRGRDDYFCGPERDYMRKFGINVLNLGVWSKRQARTKIKVSSSESIETFCEILHQPRNYAAVKLTVVSVCWHSYVSIWHMLNSGTLRTGSSPNIEILRVAEVNGDNWIIYGGVANGWPGRLVWKRVASMLESLVCALVRPSLVS